MNTKSIDAIANAVLYEGYMLYPYRPSSVKNRQRFNFGVLYPRAYSEAQTGSDAWSNQTECLVEGSLLTAIEIKVRFLKLVARATESKATNGDGQASASWQEAIECDVTVPITTLSTLLSKSIFWTFNFPARQDVENLPERGSQPAGQIVRRQDSVQGAVRIAVELVRDEVFKVTVLVENLAPIEGLEESRDQALMRSLVSAHILLGVTDGRFVSLLDPPGEFAELAGSCRNIGTWPVLVGAEGDRDTMLSSPIILYDYPQIAPESPGDLFDGTEIDEILALRIMTMTDAEKLEMRHADERARKMLERTEALPMEHLMKLHGTLRELRPIEEETP
jgi:hydrogenase maturation protease